VRTLEEKAYHLYTTRDFVLDEYFQQWVLHPDVKNTWFWEKWMQEHPEKRAVVQSAVDLIRSIHFEQYTLSVTEKAVLWDNIWDQMAAGEDTTPAASPRVARSWLRHAWKYAAAVLVIAGLTSLWLIQQHYRFEPRSWSAATRLGEVKRAWLPDSSLVVMNAGSRLLYTEKENRVREVWLDGEAYFHVRHTGGNNRFIVHTYDKLSVEVLGTQFNVNSFGDKTTVVLEKGEISLQVPSPRSQKETRLFLQPGEMVSYNKTDGSFAKTNAAVERLTAWTRGRLLMDNYTLADAASLMLQVFGKKLVVADSQLLRYQVSGSMPLSYNADTMMTQFGRVFGVQHHQKNETIYIRKGK